MTDQHHCQIRPITPKDRDWVTKFLKKHWVSEKVVSRGQVHYANKLPGYVAVKDNQKVGLITYRIDNNECEIVTLDSVIKWRGIGSALLNAVKDVAVKAGCKRLWFITTNDNVLAQNFYERKGFSIIAIHKDAIKVSRKFKPEIPQIGINGIPIKDEVEMGLILNG